MGVLEAEVPPCGGHLFGFLPEPLYAVRLSASVPRCFQPDPGQRAGRDAWRDHSDWFWSPGPAVTDHLVHSGGGRVVASRSYRGQGPVGEPDRRGEYVSWVTLFARPATQDCVVGWGGARLWLRVHRLRA